MQRWKMWIVKINNFYGHLTIKKYKQHDNIIVIKLYITIINKLQCIFLRFLNIHIQ